jgi:hypothetical protein
MMLDLVERKGTLTYTIGFEMHQMHGHFRLSLDGRTVEARKVHGRNRWGICSVSNVHDFEEVAS